MNMQLTDDIEPDVEGATDQRNTLNFIKFIHVHMSLRFRF